MSAETLVSTLVRLIVSFPTAYAEVTDWYEWVVRVGSPATVCAFITHSARIHMHLSRIGEQVQI